MGKRGIEWLTPAEFQAAIGKGATPASLRDKALRKEVPVEVKALDESPLTIEIRITTGGRDRDRDTINPSGWELADYLKNPVVLWAHDYSSLPVGKAVSITADAAGLVARDEFTPEDLYPFGYCVYRMLKAGFLNASSVGFRPVEWTFNETERGVDYIRQALLEHSIVPVPANASALVEARSAGIDLAPLSKWAEEKLDGWKQDDGLYVPKAQVEAVFRILSTKTVSVPAEPIAEPPVETKDEPVAKRGRVLSRCNEDRLRRAHDEIGGVLSQVAEQPEEDAADLDITKTPDDGLEITEPRSADPAVLDIESPPPPAKEVDVTPTPTVDLTPDDLQLLRASLASAVAETVSAQIADAVRAEFNRLRGRVD